MDSGNCGGGGGGNDADDDDDDDDDDEWIMVMVTALRKIRGSMQLMGHGLWISMGDDNGQ